MWKLILRSLVFYRRTHLGVVLGSAIGSAILVGALVVGDSVRHTLQQLTFTRLGRTEYALSAGDRFFRSALADDLAAALDTHVAPVLQLDGIAIAEGGRRRANRVQVLGVDDRFRRIGNGKEPLFEHGQDEALVNRRLAARLGLAPGDELLVRLPKADLIPGDVPLTSRDSTSVALRVTIRAIAGDEQLERFNLRPNQVSPLSVFLPLPYLAKEMELAGRANLLLVAERSQKPVTIGAEKPPLTPGELATTLAETWQLTDAGLSLRRLPDEQGFELVSDRLFLDPPIEAAALAAAEPANGIVTYFVNLIGSSIESTPYSFVAAPGPPLVPEEMGDDEIIINRWVADDIDVGKGDRLLLAFYLPGEGYKLKEATATFTVRSVVPIAGPAADRTLMPSFPGLSDADSCRDWDPGIPIDLDRIRDKDEEYWESFRGTPKAFVTRDAARRLWSNRFGSLTAVRYPQAHKSGKLAAAILERLDPASLGLVFMPVRQEGIRAGSEATDFAGLFASLSFFLIVAALLLTGLLFVLGVEQRSQETGILRALGYTPRRLRRLALTEGTVLAVIGCSLGTLGGIAYNRVVLHLLGTVWRGAVGAAELHTHVKPLTLAGGLAAGLLMAMLAMYLAARSHARQPLTELLGGIERDHRPSSRVRARRSKLLAAICLLGVLVILAVVSPGKGKAAAAAFWGAGTLMLLGSLALCHSLLSRIDLGASSIRLGASALGVRNAARKRRRGVTTIALLASGVFIVVATAANRHSPSGNADCRQSGTGGFAFYGETTIPVQHDLNDPATKRSFGLDESDARVKFVQLRVHSGDDASCLNLNRTRNPTILGVRPQELADRWAFTFVKLADGVDKEEPWMSLASGTWEGVVPAVADQSMIVWGLGKSVGDVLTYTDEQGRELKLKLVGGLANSIFQGSVLIPEQAFLAHYPSTSGSRALLVDAPKEKRSEIAVTLSRTMQDYGLDLVPTAERLAEFNTVQNTYLTIFLALGGLGLILGTAGMGVIVLRDVLEQRGQLALLRAVGFSRSTLHRMLFAEYSLTLGAGVVCGAVSAIVAVLPALLSPGGEIPYAFILLVITAIAASGVCWTLLATRAATAGGLIAEALRNE